MKRTLALLLAMLMLTGALAGCTPDTPPVDTDDSTESTSDTAETTPADTDPVVEEIPAYKKEIVKEYDGYTVTLSAPTVVFYGEEGDTVWGHHQFPGLRRTVDGLILASWGYGEDKDSVQTIAFSKISLNGGKSWVPNTGGNAAAPSVLMSNGKYFDGFVNYGTPVSNHLKEHTAAVSDAGSSDRSCTMYFAEDVADDPKSQELRLTEFAIYEYDPETKTSTVVPSTVNWPYAPIAVYPGNYIYSISYWFALSGHNVIVAEDGTLYTCIYACGFDSFADSKEAAKTDYALSSRFYVFVFASEDCGRTWDLTAQITPGEECPEVMEGYCEPKMIQMPDGSFLMLMRSGENNPMYVTRSEDGYTWTTPEIFDDIGVYPQLARFDGGVTIATYGRPYLRVAVTDDPSGATWEEPFEIPLAGSNNGYGQSCFYTGLLRLSEDTILMIYSNFSYPNRNGVGVRTILTRTITVTPNE